MTSAATARIVLLAGISAAASYAPGLHAALYKCTGADGKIAYQDAPCPSSASEQALKAKAATPAPSPGKSAAAGKAATKPAHDAAAANSKPPKSVDVNVRTDRGEGKPASGSPQPYPATTK